MRELFDYSFRLRSQREKSFATEKGNAWTGCRERLRMPISVIIFVWRARESESLRTSVKLRPALARESTRRDAIEQLQAWSSFLWFNGLKSPLVCNESRVAPFYPLVSQITLFS